MNADHTKAGPSVQAGDPSETAAQFDGEIRELIRSREVTWLHRSQSKPAGDARNINSIIQRVAGVSLTEIEEVIVRLQQMRDYLQSEGERVQREVAGYAHVSQAAMKHIGLISEQMGNWLGEMDRARAERDERYAGQPRSEQG